MAASSSQAPDVGISAKVLLLSGGLNDGIVMRVKENKLWKEKVQQHFQRLREAREPQAIKVLVCHDGFGVGSHRDATYMKQCLKDLLEIHTHVLDFTFKSPKERILSMLENTDVFYLAGGHKAEITSMFKQYQEFWQVLRNRIMHGNVFFIGACGGAMAAGRFWTPPVGEEVGMLNLLAGVNVGVEEEQYASTVEKLYVHLSPRHVGLVFDGEAQAIYILKRGVYVHAKDTEARDLERGVFLIITRVENEGGGGEANAPYLGHGFPS